MISARKIALAVFVGVFLPVPAAAADDLSKVQVWLTTPDESKRLSREADLAFSTDQETKTVFVVDASRRYQTIVGFGAALTDASAYLINNRLSPAARAELLSDLFGPAPGLHLSFTRLTIGASDFSRTHYSFNDRPAGRYDPLQRHFSIAPNRVDVLPVLKRMKEINPQLKVMATPWSAPGWMKTSDRLNTGALKPSAFGAFARYLNRYLDAYSAEGVPIYALTIQNEPHFEPADYPGMRVTPEARAKFVGSYLGPLLAKTHPEVRILDWDHNWSEPESPLAVLSDPRAARYITGVAWHCYNGDTAAQGKVHDAHPEKETYFTECSGGGWVPQWKDALTGLGGVLVQSTRYWAKGVLFWNLALDENDGPHLGGCTNCHGVVTIDSKTGAVTRNAEYYVLGHASRFVAQGAVRIDSGPDVEGFYNVAFQNPDGSIILIVVNRNDNSNSFAVEVGGRRFAYALPAAGIATFVWR